MTISTDYASWLQAQMLGLYHEEWGLVYMLYGNLASVPNDTHERWQLGTDLIYRGLVCELVEVKDFGATTDRESFLHAIRSLDPSGDGVGFWHATIVWGAPRLDKLIETHFQSPDEHDETLNPAFIAALEQIFAESGVPWSDSPLLPILPAGTDLSA
ncbi:hypothetical protein DFR50_107171 [Roseiarcus fermentans]|uniref:Uncharacterized protein n=1 Tax=Roseiarcus fermentans TaxID=1473586 RepID=A0A366FMW1_9HYPH|nr:hypothetical protein [Roseiarcus fermentans]RBP15901.1 hypothetical protein DFR50_107171 [Roseiarcus fermentans]